MIGAVAGDIIGSVYEFKNTKDYNFPLFTLESKYTDDSIMTFAVADWLLNDKEHTHQGLEDRMVSYGNKFSTPMGGYGGGFFNWLFIPECCHDFVDYDGNGLPYKSKTGRHPYNSYGNGAAMRVSPVGWLFDTLEKTERVAKISSEITHNHPNAIHGAQATAAAIWMARNGYSKDDIKSYLSNKYGYDFTDTWDNLHNNYKWRSDCKGTVIPALICFFESKDYEDAIRKAVSIGGDSDTLACITGGIAHAFYKMPAFIVKRAIRAIPKEFADLYYKLCEKIDSNITFVEK